MRLLSAAVMVAALSVLTAVAGCSSSPQPPASPLNGASALTCPGGSRDCTSPGTVRWSVPLPGSTQFDIATGTAVLNMPGAAASGISFGEIPDGYLASVVVAPGLLLAHRGLVIKAIDPATGHQRWSTRLTLPSGLSSDDAAGVTMVDANGLITASADSGFVWWLLNATTGAVSPPRLVPSDTKSGGTPPSDVVPVTPRSVVLLEGSQVQDIDPVTGAVRWRVPLRPWTGYAVVGHALYADNDPYRTDLNGNSLPTGKDRATAIQRVDLASGRVLPALPLTADLHLPEGRIVQSAPDPGVLLLVSSTMIARINPATGHPAWTRTLPTHVVGTAQAGPAGAAPSAEFLVAPPPSGANAAGPPPSPGTGASIWRVLVVSLATGQAASTALGRAFPYPAADINTGDGGFGSVWNLYGSAMLGTVSTAARSAGTGGYRYTRLEGIDPHTGRVVWRGPWSGDVYVLGETFTGPPMIIAESCAPAGLAPDQSAIHGDEAFCTSERLYAINA